MEVIDNEDWTKQVQRVDYDEDNSQYLFWENVFEPENLQKVDEKLEEPKQTYKNYKLDCRHFLEHDWEIVQEKSSSVQEMIHDESSITQKPEDDESIGKATKVWNFRSLG